MKAMFVGPLGKVTGSCTWLHDEANKWNLLVDCGLQQGERTEKDWNAGNWPFDPAKLELVVLTHAHIDHCGLIPLLYKQGFKGRVFCSKETAELAKIQLTEALRLSELPYEEADIQKIKWHEPNTGGFFGKFHPAGDDLFLRFFRAAHVIGAVSVAVYWGPKDQQRSINFSGDLGPDTEDAENLPWLRHRMGVARGDFAVVESTYGEKVRDAESNSAAHRRARLRELMDKALAQKGALVLPAFALGRTQDVLFDIQHVVAESGARYKEMQFVLDAPSAVKMQKHMVEGYQRTENNGQSHGKVRPNWLGKQFFRTFGLDDKDPEHCEFAQQLLTSSLLCKPLVWPATKQRPGNELAQAWRPVFKILNGRSQVAPEMVGKPTVLLTGSGMCNGGPAGFWLPRLLGLPSTIVAMTGYASPSSIAGQLLENAKLPDAERQRLSGELLWGATNGKNEPSQIAIREIRAHVVALPGYSAHADQKGLVDWVYSRHKGETYTAGRTIFIQHGENGCRRALANALRLRAQQLGLDDPTVLTPDVSNDVYDLDNGGQLLSRSGQVAEIEAQIRLLEEELRRLKAT